MSQFLLIHGGMLGGWCWKKVRLYLEKKNHIVFSPSLTGLGDRKHLMSQEIDLETHINDIINVIFYEDLENVILVGHSYGGMVITGVANRIPQKIKQVVYVDALIPQNGESMFDIVDQKVVSHLFNGAKEKGNGWQVPPTPSQNCGFNNQLDIQWFEKRCTFHPLKSFQQSLFLKEHNFENFEKVYIKCTRDSILDPMLTRAQKMGMRWHLLDSGHFPMITEPQKLSDLLKVS